MAITADLVARLARTAPKITVVGDAILDVWLSGRCERICREAPAPVVDVDSRSLAPGGAANTAVNLAEMGARVRFVSVLGDDDPGHDLAGELARHGVDTDYVLVEPGRRGVSKQRIVADDQVLVRFDEGDGHDADPDRVIDALRRAIEDADALVVCDYGNGLLSSPVRDEVARLNVPLLVVDGHDFQRWRSVRPGLVTPNADEAVRLLGVTLEEDRASLFERRRTDLLEATGARAAVVTLDREGALLLTPDGPAYRTWADPAPDSQASGAGDTFVAALCLGGAAGLPLTSCMELAQTAAGVVVHKNGTAVCTETELAVALTREAAVDPDELVHVVEAHHEAGRRVVFTNGCFDVLHRGHITYLNEAKRQGDVLIVALNSDESVRRLKGPDRPVNNAQDRAAVLSALSCVDHVTVFEQDTPIELLKRLKPALYVKGGDYTENMLKEAPVVRDYGGEVRVLGYVPDRSTSSLIAKIRETAK
ncbi:MAG TPA: D-glycero-beta-D-manno-heptose 1-phosphate adenylyltransferase [Amycolatopsis sp.]|uniref:D-glycero-beta-D-manno-heptose 1-phosphate adenylyltransferase n=1 Tax=Amycolatopsis sp. TaxID=37632 RepID=UPI002B483A47|nr:D-glycero-beta-D-manno-heptose 1-phosphate adenylyltransferase [Amycolatopsis sp.]HKS44375.1 D-glycero-beta-D-manno-heptose 1-phosphate adenylyltransferase [Amycolatopsis sp.]